MIGLRELIIGVLAGAFLIVLGVVPGFFQSIVDGFLNSVNLFSIRFLGSTRFPGPLRQHEEFPQPRWLAGLGALLITLTALAHLSS